MPGVTGLNRQAPGLAGDRAREPTEAELTAANHAILLTPPGAAAIAVVRIAGPATGDFLAKHFSKPMTPLRCAHGELRDDGGAVVDDPIVVLSADRAFADINLHGGPWVIASTLAL